MSSLFPIRSDPSPGAQDPRVVDLEGEEAEEVFSALSSETARRIVTALHEEPRTQSDLADAVDTTVQNVRYHLDKLESAGLVEVVDTWYSSRGNEMAVYAPADGALIVSGDRSRATRLKNALSRLVGGVTVIGMASLLVQTLATRLGRPFSIGAGGSDGGAEPRAREGGAAGDGGDGGGNTSENFMQATDTSDEAVRTVAETETTTTADAGTETVAETAGPSATATPEPTATPQSTPTDTLTEAYDVSATDKTTVTDGGLDVARTTTEMAASGGDAAAGSGLPPGLLFFLGGVSVLVVLVSVWYWSGN